MFLLKNLGCSVQEKYNLGIAECLITKKDARFCVFCYCPKISSKAFLYLA